MGVQSFRQGGGEHGREAGRKVSGKFAQAMARKMTVSICVKLTAKGSLALAKFPQRWPSPRLRAPSQSPCSSSKF